MIRSISILGLALACAAGAQAGQFHIGDHNFTLPDGFTIEKVSGQSLVQRPVEMDFDEAGNLYVSDASGTNEDVKKQLENKPHRVLRLTDADGDGVYEKTTVFADKMMFPEGVMWHRGSLYVCAPPSIWKLTDTDGDGVADQRVEWYNAKTLTHCANDLHGPYLGLDGLIYWCKGAFDEQTHNVPGHPNWTSKAAHIFRAPLDASYVEPVMTGGMDNPVEVAFTAGGERIFTTTFFQNPGNGFRDGLIHAIYGGVYGKANSVTDTHPKTGELMPVLLHLGAAAPCGLTRYESTVFGEGYQDNLFATLFNLHKVSRCLLTSVGSSFTARAQDFLTSDNLDFHPTDVLEDADGSLLVLDTGGWYKICCPTSQLAKPDILGAIYRIRKTGTKKITDPRGLLLPWKSATTTDLPKFLRDARPAVRRRAVDALAVRGAAAVKPLEEFLRKEADAGAKAQAIWSLTRISGPEARAAVRFGLRDTDELVAQAAAHSASVWRDANALPELIALLEGGIPSLQRVAAEAIGRVGDSKAVVPLLNQAGFPHDRALEHSLIYALIEIGSSVDLVSTVNGINPLKRRAALIALDQMKSDKLNAESVIANLGSINGPLRETCLWIAAHHPEWGAALVSFLDSKLGVSALADPEQKSLRGLAEELAGKEAIQVWLAKVAKENSPQRRLAALTVMAGARSAPAIESWVAPISQALTDSNTETAQTALKAARLQIDHKNTNGVLLEAVAAVARNSANPSDHRLNAFAALPAQKSTLDPASYEFLVSMLDPALSVAFRSLAADILGRSTLSASSLIDLGDRLSRLGPLELGKILAAFDQSTSEEVGKAWVGGLSKSSAASSLMAEQVSARVAKYPVSVQTSARPLLTILTADSGKQNERLEQLLKAMPTGDIRRGQAIFNSPKAACSSCHAIGYLGGKVGPDLTNIGEIRSQRDLLESVLYPSTSFVRSFEPMIVISKVGEMTTGILKSDVSAEELVLVTGPQTEVHVAKADVASLRPGTISIMPQGLDQQLTSQELSDLITFLKNTHWGPR